jgi:5-methyltetrahydropteroyltriglutamate--homocysteine methyltransferase
VIADGELSRFDVNHPETNGMIEHFVRPMSGMRTALTAAEREEFRRQEGMGFRGRPAAAVEGAIGPGTLDLKSEFEFVRPLTREPLKFTVTSPYMLAKTLLDSFYRDRRALVEALAEVLRAQIEPIGADVLQVDEANLPGSPADARLAADGINRVLAGARGRKAVHLCFGNYGGQTIQRGTWTALLEFFNALQCDHLVLEFTRRAPDELAALRDVKPSIALGIGVIDIKSNDVEAPETVAARIEAAVRLLGDARVQWVHPDCGFWMLPRSVADRKMEALVKGRDLFLGSRR